MLLIFAFRHTVAEEVAKSLSIRASKLYIDSTMGAIHNFVHATNFKNYTHVLGLGEYSGKDQGLLRIETWCSSQFRNRKDDVKTLPIPYFLKPSQNCKLANGIGNSWCNFVSYALLRAQPTARFTFVHIPASYVVPRAVEELALQLESLNITKGMRT